MKSQIMTALAILGTLQAHGSEVDIDFYVKGAQFKQVITLQFDSKVSLAQTRVGFTDPDKINSLSDFIVANRVLSSGTTETPAGLVTTYSLYTEVDLRLINGKTYSNCRLTSGVKEWTQSCVVDLTRGNSGKGLRSGRSDFKCTQVADAGPTCVLTYSGETKDVDYWLVKRRAQRLAVSGGMQTGEDYLRTFYELDQSLNDSMTHELFPKSQFKAMMTEFLNVGHLAMDRTPEKYNQVRGGATYYIKGHWQTGSNYQLSSGLTR